MKKTLALATCLTLAATAAQAQSTVQLMGLADMYVGSMRMAGDAKSSSKVGNSGMTTSWWGMKGTEDLGGGLKANVALTGFLRMDSGSTGRFGTDTMFSRDANVSLSGSFGTVMAGRGMAPNFLPTILFNPLGDSFTFSPLVIHANVTQGTTWPARTTPADTGWSSQIVYSTPKIAGFNANIHYQLAGVSGKKDVGLNAFYSIGPVSLTAFWEQAQLSNPVVAAYADGSTKTDWMLGGTYDAGVAKGFLTYGQAKSDKSTGNAKTTQLGVSVPMGAGKVLASYATTKNTTIGKTRDTFTVGYDHFLSKRTDVYTMLMNDQVTGATSGTSLGFGVRHRF